ncbi:MAG: MgtC/SapB family protein [Acaryochloridaceae cyanobacterium CSU_3_4]|nr:MgtC/SapB family protein [Acaryochloridaceae cyanobacterium CSU_3_4]
MTGIDFGVRLGIAFVLGGAIGIERQWGQTKAVLKTNVLVCIGSAMFVMMSAMTPGDSSPTRVAAQVVSGIGFLGGGVILREGTSVKGLNTAATLWCAAAVGTLVGSGLLTQAYLSSLAVVAVNLFLRPVVDKIKVQPISDKKTEIRYRFRVISPSEQESRVSELLLDTINENALMLAAYKSHKVKGSDDSKNSAIVVDFITVERNDDLFEQTVERLKSEVSVSAVSWKIVTGKPNP